MNTIPLMNISGEVVANALVSDTDYIKYGVRVWYTYKNASQRYARYCYRKGGRKGDLVTVFLHREILGLPHKSDNVNFVDHINGDILDNRRENLRIVNASINIHNGKLRKDNRSGHRGVVWHGQQKKWRARIFVNNKPIELGCYLHIEDAAKAVHKATKDMLPTMPARGK